MQHMKIQIYKPDQLMSDYSQVIALQMDSLQGSILITALSVLGVTAN